MIFDDHTPRYVPDQVMTLRLGMDSVKRIVGYPPDQTSQGMSHHQDRFGHQGGNGSRGRSLVRLRFLSDQLGIENGHHGSQFPRHRSHALGALPRGLIPSWQS